MAHMAHADVSAMSDVRCAMWPSASHEAESAVACRFGSLLVRRCNRVRFGYAKPSRRRLVDWRRRLASHLIVRTDITTAGSTLGDRLQATEEGMAEACRVAPELLKARRGLY